MSRCGVKLGRKGTASVDLRGEWNENVGEQLMSLRACCLMRKGSALYFIEGRRFYARFLLIPAGGT